MVADCSRLAALVLLLPSVNGFSAGAVGSARCSVPQRTAPIFLDAFADEVCSLEGVACAYDPDEIDARFEKQPLAVAGRVAEVLGAYGRVKLAGEDGGQTLRTELGQLGPVFCSASCLSSPLHSPLSLSSSRALADSHARVSSLAEVGQTLATRPDIIGLDTSRNLGQLQDAMAPEAGGPKLAMAALAAALDGDVSQYLVNISATPIAAASLAEVYRATTLDGVDVAVKIQRPGLERKVALDLHVLRKILALAQRVFKIGGDVSVVVAVLDEVGAGLFRELDFETEAAHINRFRSLYAKRLESLGVVVPSVRGELTSQQVLVTEWLDGVPPRELAATDRQSLAKTAVRCLAMQLMTDGFIHCDPHEGNLLALRDGRVALLDFGLMAQMRTDHQEAMAHGVLNIMSENYPALEQVFRGMGVLDISKPDLRRPGVEEPFANAIERCMTGGASAPADEAADDAESESAGAAAVQPAARKKIVQDADGGNRRRAFGQLYEELSELAFKYYFTIPSYYILVMRAFVTLEGIALSADDDESFNMYEATAPYARRKLLTPQTKGGRTLLKAALTSRDGRRALRAGLRWPRRLRWMPRLVGRGRSQAEA